jgi:putative Holliday junction resolvase
MPNHCYIGIDFGLRNIGVAVGQTITKTARALKTIHIKNTFNWLELDEIIKQWQPSAIIIGKPLTEQGQQQLATKQAHNFAKKVKQRYQLSVHEVDERYTSISAQQDFADARKSGMAKRKHGENLDAHAAKNILQRWLDNLL